MYIPLNNRQIIRISGEDRFTFIQGLITNDIELLKTQDSLYACLLSPQGKFLFEFFIFAVGDELWLDTEKDRAKDAFTRLSMYKLRAKATLTLDEDHSVFACITPDFSISSELISIQDPRHLRAGRRVYSKDKINSHEQDSFSTYDIHRLQLGLPDGARDMDIERSTMAEARMEEIHGVSYKKGCYIGQEVTARMHNRGLVKKQIMPIKLISGTFPAYEDDIKINDVTVGQMRSSNGSFGMALLRLDKLDNLTLPHSPIELI